LEINLQEVTEQEEFWANDFGDHYVSRNNSTELRVSNIALFSKILRKVSALNNVIEFGCNIGLNLEAISFLSPNTSVVGVEINKKACEQLASKHFKYFNESFLGNTDYGKYDMTFTKGVLIHQDPNKLKLAYEKLYNHSSKFILIIEYYSPSPVSIIYRGQKDKLFKRDFAGEILNLYPNLKLVDYGFVYRRDNFPQDDLTWFLLEKSNLQ
jgi:pseudaminic acid biosynthesis-associated methylase